MKMTHLFRLTAAVLGLLAASSLEAAVTSITAPGTVTILEDASTTINYTISDADDPSGASVTTTVTDPGHPAAPTLTLLDINTNTRSVLVQPGAGLFGNGNIVITAGDGTGADATRNVYLKVLTVNDEPSFTLGGNVTGTAGTAYPSGANYATAVNANDAGQTVSFTLSNNNTTLFSVQPQLTGSGATRNLVFTPRAGAGGSATVSVVGQDNGGTANGGDNSAAGSFVITVTGVNRAPTITAPATVTTSEDVTVGPVNFTIADLDDSTGTSLTVTVTASTLPAVVPTGNVSVGGAGNARTVTVTPVANQFGNATLTLQVSDGTLTATDTFLVRVLSVNDAPTITVGANQLAAASDGAQTVASFSTSSPGPANESGQGVTFLVSNNNSALFTTTGQPKISATGTLTYTPNPTSPGTTVATVSVVGEDNGSPSLQSATSTFTISIDPVNRAPSIPTGPTTTSINEDTETGDLSVTLSDLDDPTGTSLTLTASSANTGVIPNNRLILGGSGNSRTINVSPAANQFGNVLITLTVNDGTATAMRTFQVNVHSVNDAPTFSPGDDLVVQKDSAFNSFLGWATAIDAGAPNESGQGLSFNVSNDNSTLFSVQPAINSSTGDLTFTVAANQTGTASVNITLQDNGGIANGGVNVSVTETITIKVNNPPTVAITSPEEDSLPNIFNASDAVVITGTLDDNDGEVDSIQVYNGATPLGYASLGDGIWTFNWVGAPAGAATLFAVATDDDAGQTTSDIVNVTVTHIIYVRTDGNNANTGRAADDAKLTINAAIASTSPTWIVDVGAGTFEELVVVDKPLNLRGAQAGVDAREREGAETILNAPFPAVAGPDSIQPTIKLTTGNSTVDGFLIQNDPANLEADPSGTGRNGFEGANALAYAILAEGDDSGNSILNNIIRNNMLGIYANGTDLLIAFNNIYDNDVIGPANGNGIYSDLGLHSSTITSNLLAGGHFNMSVLIIGGTDLSFTYNSSIEDNRLGFAAIDGLTIANNTVTGSRTHGIDILGGCTDVAINDNLVNDNDYAGIRIRDGFGLGANENVSVEGNEITGNWRGFWISEGAASDTLEIHNNVISGNTEPTLAGDFGNTETEFDEPNDPAGLANDSESVTIDAENNYWGSGTGPTHANNPGGTGDLIIDVGTVDYDPFLTAAPF